MINSQESAKEAATLQGKGAITIALRFGVNSPMLLFMLTEEDLLL